MRSAPGQNQFVISENVAADDEPAAKCNPQKLALSVSALDPASKLTAKGKASPLILRYSIHDEPLTAKPPVFDAYFVALVGYLPDFHLLNGLRWRRVE